MNLIAEFFGLCNLMVLYRLIAQHSQIDLMGACKAAKYFRDSNCGPVSCWKRKPRGYYKYSHFILD
jgi:hypothetical protein